MLVFVGVEQGSSLRLNGDTTLPLHLQLVHELRGAICSGRKRPQLATLLEANSHFQLLMQTLILRHVGLPFQTNNERAGVKGCTHLY